MNFTKFLLSFLAVFLLTQCSEPDSKNSNSPMDTHHHDHAHARKDVHSFAQPEKAKTTHLDLNLTADFDKKILRGFAAYDIDNQNSDRIIFDIRNLNIEHLKKMMA